MALLPLDVTLGLAVYTDTLPHPLRTAAEVRVIRQHHPGVRWHLVGFVLSPQPPLKAVRLRACILGWVTFHSFLC